MIGMLAKMAKAAITTPDEPWTTFRGHTGSVNAVAVFPDGSRMATASDDKTIRLWNLEDGVVLKKMEGHGGQVQAVAVSGDGQFIASGDVHGELIAWHGTTGESLTKVTRGHSSRIRTIDFSPDGAVLATGSYDRRTKLWSTKSWMEQGNPIISGAKVNCVRFSPRSGELLAIATQDHIEIWDLATRKCIVTLNLFLTNFSLVWTPDGTRLLSVGSMNNSIIQEWNTSTWQQVGGFQWNSWAMKVNALAVNSTGTLLACASYTHVTVWRLSDRRKVAVFKCQPMYCVTFSMDDKSIFSGGQNNGISEWVVPEPEEASLLEAPKKQVVSEDTSTEDASKKQATNKILPINKTIRNAYVIGDLPTAEVLLTQEIDVDENSHNSYAIRSFLMARKCDWDNALHDALRSVGIQPSFTGYVSQGIALCGKRLLQDAMKAFDLAFMFTDNDSKTIHLLLLIKAITLFNANQHQEAMLRIQELAVACPNADILACRVTQAYLHVQLGIDALEDACHDEAVDHFTAAINSGPFSSEQAIHLKYEVFVVLFGWNLKSLWQTANQKLCHALLRAGRLEESYEAYRRMMDTSDETTTISCRDWSITFEQECNNLFTSSGDAALAAMDYNRAIDLYSAVIKLDSLNLPDTVFEKRCRARLGKMLWEDALLDAQKVTELNPSSYRGHQLKHAALHGAQRYDEAIAAFETMISKLDDSPDAQIRQLRQQYVTLSEAASIIQDVIHAQLESTPHRLLNTFTGFLCDRHTQTSDFETSVEYKELLSSTVERANIRMGRIEEVVEMYFRCVMLSHRWEGKERMLHQIQDKDIYKLDPIGGITKLQLFCKIARHARFRWAWVDTCCIDQTNNVEVQESVNSMFVWYRHSALTIVYLLDVPPSSKSGALARSVWNKRGWTVQEFLAPKIVLFYQNDWTPYLGDCSSNHKKSVKIMRELADATGIDAKALVAFHPGMKGAREKLQWVSMRVTTLQEDIAYSLFGIFGIHLPVLYGEKKQNALGRLLQEIIAQSGDITSLDWVGKSSKFNSCLPASITSYGAPPSATLSPLSEEEIQTSVSSLRYTGAVETASKLYAILYHQSAPRFANQRLHLPCIVFPVTDVTPKPGQEQKPFFTYEVKADGLRELLITTGDNLMRASPIRPTFLLIRPWDRNLLELHDFAELCSLSDNTQSIRTEDFSTPPISPMYDFIDMRPTPGDNTMVHSEADSRALRLTVLLGQPFSAFLLAQQSGVEYKRIASDQHIIAQVKGMASVNDRMTIRTLEIL